MKEKNPIMIAIEFAKKGREPEMENEEEGEMDEKQMMKEELLKLLSKK